MENYETETLEVNESVFIGKRGEKLSITDSHLMLESPKELLLIHLSSISFHCEKHGKWYHVRIATGDNVDLADLKSSRCLIILKADETRRLMGILRASRN